jgi:DNA-binding response OmpR family regulator
VPSVLIVDDDADHRELLQIALLRNGYDVVQASNSAAARALLAAGGIDAALFDVRLPGEDGIELCADLRREPRTADLPIMLVSAEAHEERLVAAIAAGADDYLLKPFHRSELVVRLDALISRTGRIGLTRAARLAARAAVPLVKAAEAVSGAASERSRAATLAV